MNVGNSRYLVLSFARRSRVDLDQWCVTSDVRWPDTAEGQSVRQWLWM